VFTAVPAGAFDVSNFTFEHAFDTGFTPFGLAFNDDGTKVYEGDRAADKITETPLSTAFDVSTMGSTTTINAAAGAVESVQWNNDGTRFFQLDRNDVYQFTASSPYDITSLSSDGSTATFDSKAVGLVFNDDGSKMYITGRNSNDTQQINLGTNFDVTTSTGTSTISNKGQNPGDIAWNNDGSKFYECDQGGGDIIQFDAATPFDISNLTETQRFSHNVQAESFEFNNDGSKFFIGDGGPDEIREYRL